MSDRFYKDKLYPLQDKVLRCLKSLNTSFYLTGGTALSRHYLHHRYSDDLDLFQNQSPVFMRESDQLINRLSSQFEVSISLKDSSFVRFFVKEETVELKVELINDVGYHTGEFTSSSWFNRIDSWRNILSNKVCALTRNASKDIADILFLSRSFQFSWIKVIEDAKMKDTWVNEIDSSKIIFDFNVTNLKGIFWTKDINDWDKIGDDLKIISRELLHGFDNSLAGKM